MKEELARVSNIRRTVVKIVMHVPSSDLELEAHYLLRNRKALVKIVAGHERGEMTQLPGGAPAWRDTLTVTKLNDGRFVFEVDWVGDEPPPDEVENHDGKLVPVMDVLRYEAAAPRRQSASYAGMGRKAAA